MKTRIIGLVLLLVTPALAGTELLLTDGRTMEAVDVRRDGDIYVIGLASGGTITLPVDLVAQVRLSGDEDEGKPEKVPGLSYSEPQQLAGPEVQPLGPDESLEVFGEPSRFSPGVIDPTWRPESGFPEADVLAGSRSKWRESIVDPSWQPQSGFPEGDVLKDSRSTWRESIIDNTWTPQDGFKKKRTFWDPDAGAAVRQPTGLTTARELAPTTGDALDADVADASSWFRGFERGAGADVRFRFRLPSRPRGSSAEVRACARNVIPATGAGAARMKVAPVDGPRYSGLPIEIFSVSAGKSDDAIRAVFTVEGGACRAISGDLRDQLGIELTRSYTMAQAVEAYNAAIADRDAVLLATDEDKIDYAFAVVSLIDPAVNGRREASLVLLDDRAALEALTVRDPDACSLPESKREKAAKKAIRKTGPPRAGAGSGADSVELYTWSGAGGEVVRHRVRLSDAGKVSIERDRVAVHVGDHTDID